MTRIREEDVENNNNFNNYMNIPERVRRKRLIFFMEKMEARRKMVLDVIMIFTAVVMVIRMILDVWKIKGKFY